MKVLMTLILVVAMTLMPVGLVAQQSRTSATIGVSPDSSPEADHFEHTQLATQSGNATVVFPLSNGMTQHQLTWTSNALVSGLTVTWSASTNGGSSYAIVGTSTAMSGTLTTSGTFNMIRVAYTNYAGSGNVEADYYATSSLIVSPINPVGLTVTVSGGSGGTNFFTPVAGSAVAIGTGTSTIFAVTTLVQGLYITNSSSTASSTVTITDGNNVPFTGSTGGPSFSIPALGNLPINMGITGHILTGGLKASASTNGQILIWTEGKQ